jgi:SAM-dependent methyltransferase
MVQEASAESVRRAILKASLSVVPLALTGCQLGRVSHRVSQPATRPLNELDLDVPFVTSPDNVVATILKMANVSSSDFVLDLGSGDGRIPITAARQYGAKGLGVEIDPSLVERSNAAAKLAKVDHLVSFRVQDLFETNLSQATVITMYLLPDVNLTLKPNLQKLKPGTRIVSHDWDMGDWLPDRTEIIAVPDKKVGLNKQSKIMLWIVR